VVRGSTRVGSRFLRGSRLSEFRLKGRGRLSWRPLSFPAPRAPRNWSVVRRRGGADFGKAIERGMRIVNRVKRAMFQVTPIACRRARSAIEASIRR